MLIDNQYITLKWNNSNKDMYMTKGYVFTKIGDIFSIKAEDLSPSNDHRVNIICDYCGAEYDTEWWLHYKAMQDVPYKDACVSCAHKKSQEKHRKKQIENQWNKLLEYVSTETEYELLSNISEYQNNGSSIRYKCQKHGEQLGTYSNFIKGHGCPECKKEKLSLIKKKDQDSVEEFINSINGNKLLNKHEYIKATTRNLIVRCGGCGENYITSYNTYKNGLTQLCKKCNLSQSVNERRISNFLSSINIDFEPEKRFSDCKDKRSLPFDFYIKSCNLAIEFDGSQHFGKSCFGGTNEQAEEQFELLKKHDKIKDNYCLENGINLLRIPYWKKDKIEDIILNEINKIQTQKRYSLVS